MYLTYFISLAGVISITLTIVYKIIMQFKKHIKTK